MRRFWLVGGVVHRSSICPHRANRPSRLTVRWLTLMRMAYLTRALGAVLMSAVFSVSPSAVRVGEPVVVVPPAPSSAGFTWPISPEPPVVTEFDPPDQPYGRGHRGVDLAAAAGSLIRAAGGGRVVFAGKLAGRGVVSIEHVSGLRTTYEPVTAEVAAGASVVAGDPIGLLEAGHPSCAPADCLHWGAKVGDSYLNPLTLLGRLQVRLLPWDG